MSLNSTSEYASAPPAITLTSKTLTTQSGISFASPAPAPAITNALEFTGIRLLGAAYLVVVLFSIALPLSSQTKDRPKT